MIDLKYGEMFGSLRILDYSHTVEIKSLRYYNVECQCENKTIFKKSATEIKRGIKLHCGCMTKELMSKAQKKYCTYDLSGDFGIGYTLKGEEFYFDLEDYELIKEYCWNFHGDNRGHDYLVARSIVGKTKEVRLHRLVMDAKEGEYVDHIHQKTYDNRKSQLRITTNQQNCFNHKLHSHNTHGNKGLTQRENGRWRARIWVNYETIDLGTYEQIEDAIEARKKAEIKYFGEYSKEYREEALIEQLS